MNVVPKTLSPLLNVSGGADAITFYQEAFGVEERFRVENDYGHIVATLGVGEMEFWSQTSRQIMAILLPRQ
jgi:uncharacterized glyoxalase superfamily protein PhnB